MAATLLTTMLLFTCICEGALLRKSAAFDFLHKVREKRAAECFPGGCSTEVSETQELIEVDSGYEESSSLPSNEDATQKGIDYQNHGSEVFVDEGSGM